MTREVLSQLAEMPSRRLDEASALAIQQSRTAAVRLWDEITRLLVGDPFTSGREREVPQICSGQRPCASES